MTITAIKPYALPTASEMPDNRILWQAEPGRAALLVHDMQRYFLRFYQAEESPMREALSNMQRLLSACRQASIPIIYSAQPADVGSADRKLLGDVWGPGLTACPEQADVVEELAPSSSDLVMKKTRYSAFHRTALRAHLELHGRDQLWIVGVYGHIGCMLTAFDAFMSDVKPFLVLDAVMDFDRDYHDLAGRMVSERCGVVTRTDALLAKLDAAGHQRWAQRATEEAVGRLVSLEGATADTELRDLGLDSVRMLELVETLRTQGAMVESVELLECQRLDELYAAVGRARRVPVRDTAGLGPLGAP